MTYVPPVQPPFVIDAVPFVMVACPIVVVLFRSGPAEKRTMPVGAGAPDAVESVVVNVTDWSEVIACVLSVSERDVVASCALETASDTLLEEDAPHAIDPFGLYCALTWYVPAWSEVVVRLAAPAVRLVCPRLVSVAVDEPMGVNCATHWT